RRDLAVAPRLARWAEIRGDTGLARRLLAGALATARRRRDLPPEQLAWFYLRTGDYALRYGRLDEAAYALQAGLDVFPSDYDLLAWALHKSGRDGEAREAMATALAQGTKDPQLLRHAAEIPR